MAKIVKENMFEYSGINISAGLVIICNNKILLAHPTGSSWKHTYSIPKGHVEEGESLLDAAIRETHEEIGLKIEKSEVSKDRGVIDYDRNGKIYKKVYYFVVYLSIEPEILLKNLEKEEIDHAKFFYLDEARSLIFNRFIPLLDYIK